jgi:phosphoglucomutase
VASKKITLIGNELDEAYFAMALQMVYPAHLVNKERLKIVYTPLHGTGAAYIEHLFRQLGFNFNTVAAQREGDGNFPTVSYPNPEEPAGLKLALDEAKATKAHLVLATDPDSDRLAVAYANKEGNFEVLNGHQMGALFAHYLIQRAKARGINLDKAYIVKSLVTSDFEAKIAQDAGVTCYNVLTGFKWIAHEIRQQEALGKHFILGNEEAIGYLVQTAIRDKDGITAALVASEMALYYLNQNKTLGNVLDELYAKFGYYNDSQISKSYTGEAGAKIIVALMKKLREKPPVKLGERLVDKIYDYEHCTIKNSAGSLLGNLDYAKSNIMQFYFSDGSRLSVRPSGTEPKIKFYISAVGKTKGDLSLHKAVEQLIDELTR